MASTIKSKILTGLTIIFGLFFINAGLDKFLHYMPVPADLPEKMLKAFAAFTEIGWLMPLVGFAELVGGVMVIIPKTRALGALIIFPVMVGIFLTNIVQNIAGLPIAIVFGAILIWIMYDQRAKYLPIIK
ncbi:MAG: DoxX family protein [Sediminibacterium sp.]|nr:DoxX family protein [Sediminibacterium sp.]